MGTHEPVGPVPAPEAFEDQSEAGQLSQAALLLSVGAAAAGHADIVPTDEHLELPALHPLRATTPMDVGEATRYVDLSVADHLARPDLRIEPVAVAPLARRLVDRPDPGLAASMIEASQHSPHRVVRTAATVAALDTTGPREDLLARLADDARARDELVRELARIGLGRVAPDHEALDNVVVRSPARTRRSKPSNTAVLTHGTFSARTRWWRPGGRFHAYLTGLDDAGRVDPPLHPHDPSFQWTGYYSEAARTQAADELASWLVDQQLEQPDLFGHSHGATVANLATRQGTRFARLVLLSWPVHEAWIFDPGMVDRVIDVRVRSDLVIIADRGGQSIRNPAGNVTSHVNGWFRHDLSYDPGYWERHGLPELL